MDFTQMTDGNIMCGSPLSEERHNSKNVFAKRSTNKYESMLSDEREKMGEVYNNITTDN